MTFSRPNIGPTDAFGRVTRSNDQRGADRVFVPDPNTRFSNVDARNPSIIRQAGENEARRVQAFFDGISKLIEAGNEIVQTRLDTSEVEGIVNNPEVQKSLRRFDEKGQSVFNSLRTGTRERIAELYAAKDSVDNYARQIFLQTTTNLPTLSRYDSKLTPEQNAERQGLGFLDMESKVSDSTGVNKLPVQVLRYRIPEITQARAAAKSIVMNKTRENQEADLQATQRQGVRGTLSALTSSLDQLGRQENNKTTQGNVVAAYDKAKQELRNLSDSSGLTKAQTAGMVAEAILNTVSEVVNGNKTRTQAIKALNSYEIFAKRQFFDDGTNLFSQAVGQNGESLGSIINNTKNKLLDENDRENDRERRKNTMRQLANLYAQAASGAKGSDAVLKMFIDYIQQNDSDPDAAISGINQIMGLGENLRQRQMTPTEDQLINAQILNQKLRELKPEERNEAIMRELRNKNILPSQLRQLDVNSPAPQSVRYNAIMNVFAQEGETINANLENLAKDLSTVQPRFNRSDKQKMRDLSIEYKAQIQSETYKEISRQFQGGKQPTLEDIRNIMRQIEPIVRKKFMDKFKLEKTGQILENDKAVRASEATIKLLEEGKKDVDAISPETKALFREKYGRAGNYKQLEQFQIKLMQSVESYNQDGKIIKPYGNPAEILRKAAVKGLKPIQSLNGATGVGLKLAGHLAGVMSGDPIKQAVSGVNFVKTLGETYGLKMPNNPLMPDAKSAELTPQQRDTDSMVALAVHTVAPAARKPGNILNNEYASIIPRIKRDPSIVTRMAQVNPLPQLNPALPVSSSARLTVTNSSPFAILIGINEGTRLPDGSYTAAYARHQDPNTNRVSPNIGNYSADSSQYRTPQQADRAWNARLSNLAVQVSGVLERLGVPRNTVGHQRLLFNALDTYVTSEEAGADFIKNIGKVAKNPTIEAIARLRRDSFYYRNGKWGGYKPPAEFLRESLKRALTFDYFNPIMEN